MRKERVMAIITTMYFFFYCILISIFGVILIYTGYSFNQITDLVSDSILKADGVMIVISGFFSMFGILGQVTSGLLVLVIGIIWILCIGIFTHSCLYLRKNQTSVKEEKRLTRDAFIKALFFTCITVLYFSIFEFAQICNIRSLIMFFAMIGIPFLLTLITITSCLKKNGIEQVKS